MLAIEGPVLKKKCTGISLVVQWLRLRTSTVGGAALIPGWGTRFSHTSRRSQKKEKKKKRIWTVGQLYDRGESSAVKSYKDS